jgi:CRISPR/Cas system endoribonuclease Cas6 (RAMP superfamily)
MLAGAPDAAIPLTAPHAVVSGWLDDRGTGLYGPQAARSVHTDQAKKWAFGPLRAAAGSCAGIVMQIRLLDDALGERLIACTASGTAVRLGSSHYRVREPAWLVEQVSWPDLCKSQGIRAWQVRFVSPACARRRNRAAPLLNPDTLALGLAERWRLLDPPTVPALPWLPGAGPVWVSDLDGHTEVQLLSRRTQRDGKPAKQEEVVSGFVGRVRYVCDHGTDTEAAAFGALLAFASFAGAGSHTAYGFGVLVPEPTWQPPTVRAGSK